MMKHTLGLLGIGWILAMHALTGHADEKRKTTEELREQANRYEHGRGVERDLKAAYRLYCEAALDGDAESAFGIGWMYFNGRGLSRQPGRALGWFRRAANDGHLYARRMAEHLAHVSAEEDPDCQKPVPTITARWHGPPTIIRPTNKQIEAMVLQVAQRYAIDPQLVFAVMRAESGFNPSALSPKHAQGLMQLIPETAERFGVKDVWDPAENIRGGTAYLHWLLRHFSGKVELVLAAYNAGEQAVERYQGVPPYEETQNYVRMILAAYQKTEHPVPPEPRKKAAASSGKGPVKRT